MFLIIWSLLINFDYMLILIKCVNTLLNFFSLFFSWYGASEERKDILSLLYKTSIFEDGEKTVQLLFLAWAVGNERPYPHTFEQSQNTWMLFLSSELNIGNICLKSRFSSADKTWKSS